MKKYVQKQNANMKQVEEQQSAKDPTTVGVEQGEGDKGRCARYCKKPGRFGCKFCHGLGHSMATQLTPKNVSKRTFPNA